MLKITRYFNVNIIFNSGKEYKCGIGIDRCYNSCRLSSNYFNFRCNFSFLSNNKHFAHNKVEYNLYHSFKPSIFTKDLVSLYSTSLCNVIESMSKWSKKHKKENETKKKNCRESESYRSKKKQKRKIKELLKKCKRDLIKSSMSDDLIVLQQQRKMLKKELKLLSYKDTYSKDDLCIKNSLTDKENSSYGDLKFSKLRNCFSVDSIDAVVAKLSNPKITLPIMDQNKKSDLDLMNHIQSENDYLSHILSDKMKSLPTMEVTNEILEVNQSENSGGKIFCDVGESNSNTNSIGFTNDRDEDNNMSWRELKMKNRSEREKLEKEQFEKIRENEYTMRATGLLDEPYDPGEKRVVFKVVSYNVLSQTLLVDNIRLYRNHNPNYLKWEYRSKLLMEEFEKFDADILCLQEVQDDQRVTFFDELKKKGYDGVYKKRTSDKADGCTIYYKTNKFKMVDYVTVEFFQAGIDILNRDNIALVIKLHPIGFPKNQMVVATTHLLYNPRRHDVKLAQIQVLLAEIDRLAFKNKNAPFQYYPVILTGDFNLEPYTGVYQLLYAGQLYYEILDRKKLMYSGPRPYPDTTVVPPAYGPPMGKLLLPPSLGITDYCQHYHISKVRNYPFGRKHDAEDFLIGIYNSDRNNQPIVCDECEEEKKLFSTGVLYNENFNFHSVYYHDDDENNVEATTKHDCWTTVDYIFYTPLENKTFKHNQLQLINRMRLPKVNECEEHVKNIPNRICPSDHFPLVASFFLRIPTKPV